MLSKKVIVARLYNLRSGVDGMISLYNSNVMKEEQFEAAVASLCSSALDEPKKKETDVAE